MSRLSWRKGKGWRIQDNDQHTWFRCDAWESARPPAKGWAVYDEGGPYIPSDLNVHIYVDAEVWLTVSSYLSPAELSKVSSHTWKAREPTEEVPSSEESVPLEEDWNNMYESNYWKCFWYTLVSQDPQATKEPEQPKKKKKAHRVVYLLHDSIYT